MLLCKSQHFSNCIGRTVSPTLKVAFRSFLGDDLRHLGCLSSSLPKKLSRANCCLHCCALSHLLKLSTAIISHAFKRQKNLHGYRGQNTIYLTLIHQKLKNSNKENLAQFFFNYSGCFNKLLKKYIFVP